MRVSVIHHHHQAPQQMRLETHLRLEPQVCFFFLHFLCFQLMIILQCYTSTYIYRTGTVRRATTTTMRKLHPSSTTIHLHHHQAPQQKRLESQMRLEPQVCFFFLRFYIFKFSTNDYITVATYMYRTGTVSTMKRTKSRNLFKPGFARF